MAITSVSSTTTTLPTALTAQPASTNATAKDQFMRLFVAQLQHQDPLDPQKGTEMVAQLAQMTAVEQAQATNDHLASLELGQAAAARSSMAALVGKTIRAKSSALTLPPGGVPAQIAVKLGGTAKSIEVTIVDQAGRPVRTMKVAGGTGTINVPWDGKADDGKLQAPGTYQVSVKATDAAGASIDASSEVSGVIDGVDYDGGGAKFTVGGVPVSPADVLSISK